METGWRGTWSNRLDRACVIGGGLIPIGIVIGNAGFESVIALVGLFWIIRCVIAQTNPLPLVIKHPLVLPWLAWYAAILISLIENGPGAKGLAHDIVFIRYLLFGVALLEVSRRQPVAKYCLYGLAAGVVWAALNTLSAYAIGSDLLGKPLVRYTGKLKEASRISGLAAFSAPFFLLWGLFDRDVAIKKRGYIIGTGLAALIQVLQTHVRTAAVGCIAGAVTGLLLMAVKRRAYKRLLTISLLLILIVGTFAQKQQKLDAFSLSNVYDRVYYWKVAWSMWKERPLTGVGVSSFQNEYKATATSGTVAPFVAPDGNVYRVTEETHAHSLFFMLLACTGLLGLASFGWLYVNATLLAVRQVKGLRIGLITWPAGFLVIGLTGYNIYHSWYQALLAFFLVLIGSVYFTETAKT